MRPSSKGSQAAPNQGSVPNQTYMQRPGYRANLPHQQRPPLHQSAGPRPNIQQAGLPGSIPSQSTRTATQNAATSGASKLVPVSEKLPESASADKMSKNVLLQEKHGQQPTKDVQSNETNDISGQKSVGETMKAEKLQPDNKSYPVKQELANEKLDQKNMPPTEAGFGTGPIKSEVSDSPQQQISAKDLHKQKQEGNSQQLTPQKKVVEDISQKSEGGSDRSLPGASDRILQEPVGQSVEASLENTSLRQDGIPQQHTGQVQEGTFHQNVPYKVQEARRGAADEKKQSARNSQDTHQWQEGNAPQKSSQGQDRSLQQSLRQGPVEGLDRTLLHPSRPGPNQGQNRNLFQPSRQGPDQGHDKNILHPPRQGPVQGQDRNLTPPRQGPPQGQDRNLLQPQRQGPNQLQSRNSQHHLYQGPIPGHERNMQQSFHPGSMQGQDRTLQQPLQQDRDGQQVPLQAQGQQLPYERFHQPRQGQLQGQQLPYLGQPEGHDRNFQQLPYPGQSHDMPEQFQLSSTKQAGIPPMSSMPQLQPTVSSSMPSLARGHGQITPQPKSFDLLSPAHLHGSGPRSSQGESMLGLPSSLSLPSSMPHHLSSFEGPRGFMERGLQFGQTLQQSTISKPMDHTDILGNKRPEHFDNKQIEQHLTGPRFPMGHSSGFQPHVTKINGGTNKGHIEGMHAPSFPPIVGEEGGFQSMHQESSRQAADRKEFQESSRKYKPGQFDGQLPSNADELFPSARHQKSHPTPTSKFDQITPTSRPLEMGPHGFFPDANSKYPFNSAGIPAGGPSKLFPPYQSLGSFPSGSGGPSMFSSEIGDGSRLPGIHEDMMGRRPEASGVKPDFMGSRMEFGRSRLDPLAPPRSPGKEYMGPSSGRANIGPTGGPMGGPVGGPTAGFGSGVGGPSFLSHPIEDFSRNPLGFDEQRNKSFGFHSSALHNTFQPGQHPMGVGNRMPPFHSSGPAPGGPGQLGNHMMIGEPGANFGANVPMQGFPGDGGFHQMGQMPNDIEPMDPGRKRKPGSTGWCRICQVDCYTVEGLEQHSQTREHQKTAMDMVLSIKQDNAKKQKHSTEDPTSQENGNKTKRSGFEGRGTRR